MNENSSLKVIAYEPDGVKIFDTINEAAKHYGLTWMTVYWRIKDGETTNDVSFDWYEE